VGIAAGLPPALELLAARRARRPHLDRALAALHDVPELQPGAEPRDSGRGRAGHRDQQLVADAVGVEVTPGGKPALPAFRASELLDGLAGVFAVGAAALSALLVS